MDNLDIPVIDTMNPIYAGNISGHLFTMIKDLCSKIEEVTEKQLTLYSKDRDDEPIIETEVYDPEKSVCLFTQFIPGDSITLIPFFGYFLETKSGYIVRDKASRMVLGDLASYLKANIKGFDYNLFIGRIEQYYLSELDSVEELFSYTFAEYTVDKTKSNLHNIIAMENIQLKRENTNKGLSLPKILKFMLTVHRLDLLVTQLIESLGVHIQGTTHEFENDPDKLQYFPSTRPRDSYTDMKVRQFYFDTTKGVDTDNPDAIDTEAYKKIVTQSESVFNAEYEPNVLIRGKKEKISKSESKFLRMIPLIQASQDDELKCFSSLFGEKQEIIDSIKDSKFKDVIKGAFLKGVITKKDNIVKELFTRKPDIVGSLSTGTLASMTKDFRVACKFFLDISKRICKPRL